MIKYNEDIVFDFISIKANLQVHPKFLESLRNNEISTLRIKYNSRKYFIVISLTKDILWDRYDLLKMYHPPKQILTSDFKKFVEKAFKMLIFI